MALEIRGMAPLLQVFDMPKSVAFYCNILGFDLVTHSPLVKDSGREYFHWALLRLHGVELMLNTAYDEGERPTSLDPRQMAAHEDTCLYFSAPDVDAVYRHLCEKGIAVEKPRVAPYGMKQLYLHDPDGYGLCFQWAVDS